MAVLALHPDAPDMRVAALAASKVVAENGANKGDHPAAIRKDHGMIWNDMERDGKDYEMDGWMDQLHFFPHQPPESWISNDFQSILV